MKLAFTRFGDSASKTALVFVHGHTSSKETWAPIIDKFTNYDCIALDLRGHGESPLSPLDEDDYRPATMVRDLHSVVEEEIVPQDKNIFLIGHSMGGRMVVPYAAMFPERISGVVIEDMDMKSRSLPQECQNISDEHRQALRAFDRQFDSLEECSEALQRFGFSASHVERWAQTDRIKKQSDGKFWCCIHPWVTHNCLTQILCTSGLNEFQTLAGLTIPVVLTVAESGSAASPEGIEEMKQHMPRLDIHHIAGSDHSIHRSQRDKFVQTVEQFIQSSLSS